MGYGAVLNDWLAKTVTPEATKNLTPVETTQTLDYVQTQNAILYDYNVQKLAAIESGTQTGYSDAAIQGMKTRIATMDSLKEASAPAYTMVGTKPTVDESSTSYDLAVRLGTALKQPERYTTHDDSAASAAPAPNGNTGITGGINPNLDFKLKLSEIVKAHPVATAAIVAGVLYMVL